MGRSERRLMTRTASLAAGVALAMLMSGCAASGETAESGESSEIRVAFIPNANHLPLLVAEEEGYFDDEGLDVTLNPVQNLGTLAGAMGKQFDLGSSTIPDVILLQQQGLDLALATNLAQESSERPTVGVLVGADSPITSAKDLEGKQLAAATLGGNLHRSVLHWLEEDGADLDKITVAEVPFPNMADQLKAGRVDAVESLEPFRSQLLAAGARELVDPLTELADPISFVSLMATSDWITSNEEQLKKFNAALDKAIAFIESDDEGARRVLAESTELPAEVVRSVPLPKYSTELPQAEVSLWAHALADIGQLKGAPDSVDPALIIPGE